MDEKTLKLFFEIHTDLPREGPGSFEATERAYNSIKEFLNEPLILDIGCGPGKQTIDLLKISDGKIIAIDNHQPFIERLKKTILDEKLEHRAKAQIGDMFNLEFEEQQFDLIWSEGAMYQLGFEKGLKDFRKYLKPGGFIAVTEASWTSKNISQENAEFWANEYPGIKHYEENLQIAENCGYKIVDHFILNKSDWFNDYYIPMMPRMKMLKEKYPNDETAQEVVGLHEWEIEIMDKYSNECGYVFFILQRND